ncbi:MAG: SBBP repeat-containing protein [Bacteroidota bacterium]
MKYTYFLLSLCFLASSNLYAQDSLGYQWVQQASGMLQEEVTALAFDPAGSLIIAGTFRGKTGFGTDSVCAILPEAKDREIFLAKYDTSGQLIWLKSGGSRFLNFHDEISNLTIDSSGNVYVTGTFRDTLEFNGQQLLSGGGTQDAFLLALDSNGNVLWMRNDHQTIFEVGKDVGVNGQGEIVFLSRRGGTGQFRPAITKFASNGDTIWLHAFTDILDAAEMAIGPDDKIYLTGFMGKNLILPSGDTLMKSPGNGPDHYVLCLDTDGNILWGTKGTTGNDDRAHHIEVDSQGNVFVHGRTNSWLAWGADTLWLQNTEEYIVKYGPSGEYIEARLVAGTGASMKDMTLDQKDNLWIAGSMSANSLLGDSSLDMATARVVGLASFDNDLNFLRLFSNQTNSGSGKNTEALAIAIDSAVNLYVGGSFLGDPSFGELSLSAYGSFDAWWGRISPKKEDPTSVLSLIGEEVKLFPNPNQGSFFLSFPPYESGPVQIIIRDQKGSVVLRKQIIPQAMSSSIHLPPLPTGMYQVDLQSLNRRWFGNMLVRQ